MNKDGLPDNKTNVNIIMQKNKIEKMGGYIKNYNLDSFFIS